MAFFFNLQRKKNKKNYLLNIKILLLFDCFLVKNSKSEKYNKNYKLLIFQEFLSIYIKKAQLILINLFVNFPSLIYKKYY